MSALALQPSLRPSLPGPRRRHLALVPPASTTTRRAAPSRARRTAPVVPAAPVHVTRRGRLTVTLGVALLLLVVPAAVLAASASAGPAPVAPRPAVAAAPAAVAAPVVAEQVVVLPGDTLWSVAEEVAAPGEDVRDVVLQLEQANALTTSALQVGQRLVVPA